MSGLCENFGATSRALYLTILFFSFYFHTNTPLYPTGFTPLGVWTTGQKTSRFASEFNFVWIAFFYFGQLFLRRHFSTHLGSKSSFSLMISSDILYEKNIVDNYFILGSIFSL
jgi:hypothetical protein